MKDSTLHIGFARHGAEFPKSDVSAANTNRRLAGRTLTTLALLVISLWGQGASSYGAPAREGNSSQQPPTSAVNPVLQWNKILLAIVRTPGAQPATNHATRSFAIMHAAIYDAVNAIDRTHSSYLISPSGCHTAPPRRLPPLRPPTKSWLGCTRPSRAPSTPI